MGWGGAERDLFAPARPGRAKTRPFPHGGAEGPTAESPGLQRRFDPLQLEWVARKRGCSATGPTPRATGSPSHVRVMRRQDPHN